MSVVAFTFCSFGDIVTLLLLCKDVTRLLTSTSGSSETYQALVLEVSNLQNFILQLDLAVRNKSNVSYRAIISDRDAEEAVTACRALLGRIQRTTERYQKVVEKASGRRWMDTWRKAGWMLFNQGEIERFRAEVCKHNQLMVRVLAALNCDSLQVVKQVISHANVGIEEALTTTSVIECDVKVILRMLHGIDGRLPRAIGYPWKGAIQPAIQFEDPLGREYMLPLEFCKNLQTLHRLMSVILDQEAPRLLAKLPLLHNIPQDPWSRAVYMITYKTGETITVHPSCDSSWPEGGLMPGDILRMSLPVVIRVLGCGAFRFWNTYTGLLLTEMLNEPFDWASPQSRKLRFMAVKAADEDDPDGFLKYHAPNI